MATRYFQCGNDRCRLKELENGFYQVAMIEIMEDDTARVFYLEQARELENAFKLMAIKGVTPDMEIEMTRKLWNSGEGDYWLQVCI